MMSGLNDSIIICDAFPKSSRKKAPLGSRKIQKSTKKSFYESPLRHIQLSTRRWEQIQAQKKLLRDAQRAASNKQNPFSLVKEESFQDSVIILSDNESESGLQEDENKFKNNEKSRKRPLEQQCEGEPVIQFSLRNSNNTIQRTRDALETQPRKRKKLDFDTPSDNDLSCLLISDTEDADITTVEIDDVDDEDIATSGSVNQGSDDILVVWSSTKVCSPSKDQSIEGNSIDQSEDKRLKDDLKEKNISKGQPTEKVTGNQSKKNKSKGKITGNQSNENQEINQSKGKVTEENVSSEKNDRVFMIDCRPNIQNLTCLSNEKTQTEKYAKYSQENFDKDDSDLFFNKPGLVLPKAQDISKDIVMEKPKSSFAIFKQQLAQHALDSSNRRALAASTYDSHSKAEPAKRLREIIIDGNNIAMAHKNHKLFSEEGLMIVIDYFKRRGHSVKVFIPQCRRSLNRPLLEKWYKEGIVIFTPSRYIGGRWITSYDDRFILEYATMCGGIVISLDQFRDLYKEKPEWRDTIMNRLLPPTFVGDIVMFPEDPLGRNGPKLDEFLRY